MHFHVVNHSLSVGSIQLFAVSSAAMLQVGDTEQIVLYSMFDTPPESVSFNPLVPLQEPEEEANSGPGAGTSQLPEQGE
jgi:spore germination protein PD